LAETDCSSRWHPAGRQTESDQLLYQVESTSIRQQDGERLIVGRKPPIQRSAIVLSCTEAAFTTPVARRNADNSMCRVLRVDQLLNFLQNLHVERRVDPMFIGHEFSEPTPVLSFRLKGRKQLNRLTVFRKKSSTMGGSVDGSSIRREANHVTITGFDMLLT
jgi:hypothetical protein